MKLIISTRTLSAGTLSLLLSGCVTVHSSHSTPEAPPLLADLDNKVQVTRQHAESGDVVAQHTYGNWLAAVGNRQSALPLLQAAAEKGDVAAQTRLGNLHLAEGNTTEAVRWLTMAGNAGDLAAQRKLAQLYARGEGVKKDSEQAFYWNVHAATQGDAVAQNDVGAAYSLGNGVRKNNATALSWYRKAAEQGYALAQFNVAGAYQQGLGVKKNPGVSYAWYSLAQHNARDSRLKEKAEQMKLRMFAQVSRNGRAVEAQRLAEQYTRQYAAQSKGAK
ncbi:tetratricopeptide repeat protein [Pantoea dispersa]|uniref:tetratricopeptide repeat protein n=1 Tax=Pantoea dispersa TaxID=59814 RepID=UPI0039B62481